MISGDVLCLSDDFPVHLISDDRGTCRRRHVDFFHVQGGRRHDISMRRPLRRAGPTVSGFAKIRQRFDSAARHELRIARSAFFDRRLRRWNIDDLPVGPAKSPGRRIGVEDRHDDALRAARNVSPRNARRNVLTVTAETSVHVFVRKVPAMEAIDRDRERLRAGCRRDERQCR